MAAWDDIKKVAGVAIGVAGGVALGGPLGVPGAIAALGGGIAGASDPAQDALNTATKIGATIAGGVGDAIMFVAETGIQLIKDLIPGAIGIRPLRGSEKTLADLVFKGTVPLHRVRIVSVYGYGARPFTIPGSMLATLGWRVPAIGPLLAWTSILTGLSGTYLIFFGDDGFRDGINHQMGSVANKNVNAYPGQTLIHELTHVWQGHYHRFAWSYVLNSLWNQCAYCLSSSTAYDYQPGLQWPDYSAEQQARLVENWFVNTKGTTDLTLDVPRLIYIVNNIRQGSIGNLSGTLAQLGAKPANEPFGASSLGLTVLNAHAAAPTKKMTKTEAEALLKQGLAMRAEGERLIRTGNPMLGAQGQQMFATGNQLVAAATATGLILMAGAQWTPGLAAIAPIGPRPDSKLSAGATFAGPKIRR